MTVYGGKSKISHKNIADGVTENDRRHGGQKKKHTYIYINKTIDKN